MLNVLLLFIGSACMLTDALGKSGRYLDKKNKIAQ